MSLVKKCRHPRGKWRSCRCSWYWNGYADGARRYINLGPDRVRARLQAARIEADRLGGHLRDAPRSELIEEVAERWLDHLEALGRRPQTLSAYRTAANAVEAWFGPAFGITRVTEQLFIDFERDAWASRRGNGPRILVQSLRGILAQAKREGLIEVVPQGTLERHSVAPNANVKMSEEETEATLAALSPAHWQALGEFLVLTGLRISEALALRWQDVDVERGMVSVHFSAEQRGHLQAPPKTETSRRQFRLDEQAVAILVGLSATIATNRPGASAPRVFRVFPYRYAAAHSAIRRAMSAAGTYKRDRGWHSLRHTNTYLRDRAGQPVRQAGAELGHGSHFAQTASYGWAAEASEAVEVSRVRRHTGSTS